MLTLIHENHLLAVLPLLALLAGWAAAEARPVARPLALLYGALSLVVGLNLMLLYGLGRGLPFPLPRVWGGLDATVLVAAGNTGVFVSTLVYWSRAMLRRSSGRATRHDNVAPVPTTT